VVAVAQRERGPEQGLPGDAWRYPPGDVVFAFVDTFIAAIGVAQSYCWESPKPAEFGSTGDYWEGVGWRVQ
jgi:hypothetical protein